MKHSISRYTKLVLINVLSAALLFEFASNVVFSLKERAFFYTANRVPTPLPDAAQVNQAVFHPYLGFINRVGRTGDRWQTNNRGFQYAVETGDSIPDCCDYPRARREDEVLVGIFGGSVALGFALAAQRSPTLVRWIQQIPAYRGREVRILNFAMSGYRQPQQLLTLAYFGSLRQEFDLVLNIDGFNEVVTTLRNWESGAEPSFPADTLWGAWGRNLEATAHNIESRPTVQALAHRLAARDWRREADSCRTAACFLVARGAEAYHRRKESAKKSVPSDLIRRTLFPTEARSPLTPNEGIHQYTAERWLDSSLAMNALARLTGARYVHILQPNPWYPVEQNYEPIDANHIYAWVIEPVATGYPALQRKIPALRAAGVEVFDATPVFEGQNQRDMFSDDCCHYTDAGYEVLFEAIGQRLANP